MSENGKNQPQDMEEKVLEEERIPLGLAIRWPIMQLGRAVADMVDGYKNMFKIAPTDLKSMYLRRFEAADARGEVWKCIRWMEKITSLDPEDPDAFYRLGVSYEKNKDAEAAIQAYKRVITIKPDHAKAHYRTGMLYLAKQEFRAAVEPLKKALKIEPDSPEINFRLGVAHDRLQEHEKAISFFSKAVEINPDFLKVYKNMALTYDSMGKHKEALECLKRALELEEMSV
jgi:tetratricopeptide (TPR) repeat protein